MATINHPYNNETAVMSGGNWVVNGSGMTPGGNPQDYYWANVPTLNPSTDYGMPISGSNQYGNTPGSTWTVSDITVTKGSSYFFFIWFEYSDPTGGTSYRAYASYYNVLAQKKPVKRAIAAAAKRGSKKAKSGGKKSKKPTRPAKAKSGKKKSKKR